MLIPAAEETEIGASHEHESPLAVGVCEGSKSFAFESEFPILDPLIELRTSGFTRVSVGVGIIGLSSEGLPILLSEEACRGSHGEIDRERRTAASIDRVVYTRSRECQAECKRVGRTITHIIEVIPILEVIPTIGERSLEIIGPGESSTESDRNAGELEHLIGVVSVLDGIT